MRSATFVVGTRLSCGSIGTTFRNHIKHSLEIVHFVLTQTTNVNHLISILPCKQSLMIVEQIKNFATVDFVKGYVDLRVEVACSGKDLLCGIGVNAGLLGGA